jgi:succinate dehydrogenase/fumarate reductase cytochrome b subunit
MASVEDPEMKKLFLEAVLAEYKRLTDEMMNHSKNMSYLFAVLVGGVATILGVFGTEEVVPFLMIPIFVSACGILMLGEGSSSALIEYYVIAEIEQKQMPKFFLGNLPIRYDGLFESRHGRIVGVFWTGLLILSSFLCVACLTALALTWSKVSQNILYEITYTFGWMTLIFYVLSAVFILHKLNDELKRIKI